MSRIIDAKGKACPMPVLMAKEAISAGESQFTVLVDNPTAVGNLQRLAANQGFDASVEERDGAYCLSFLKNGSSLPPLWRSLPALLLPLPATPSLWAGTPSATATGSLAPT